MSRPVSSSGSTAQAAGAAAGCAGWTVAPGLVAVALPGLACWPAGKAARARVPHSCAGRCVQATARRRSKSVSTGRRRQTFSRTWCRPCWRRWLWHGRHSSLECCHQRCLVCLHPAQLLHRGHSAVIIQLPADTRQRPGGGRCCGCLSTTRPALLPCLACCHCCCLAWVLAATAAVLAGWVGRCSTTTYSRLCCIMCSSQPAELFKAEVLQASQCIIPLRSWHQVSRQHAAVQEQQVGSCRAQLLRMAVCQREAGCCTA